MSCLSYLDGKVKRPPLVDVLLWLAKEADYGTFYSTEHDPNFNIEEVKELLKDDHEADNAQ